MSRSAPSHAASAIYSEGDFVYLQLHATKGYTQELSFPSTPNGMVALLRVLREREMALASQPHAFAGPTMPIQFVVDSWAKDPVSIEKARRAKELADRARFSSKPFQEQIDELTELFENF